MLPRNLFNCSVPVIFLTLDREVQAVDLSTQGYTQAADLWSLGVLTVTMLTGDCTIPRQELVGLSQIELAERYFGEDRGLNEQEMRKLWLELPPRALDFIRKLLTLDVEDRMTAEESLNHSWLTRPHREAEALNEGIEKVIRFWKKRVMNKNILEALPGVEIPSATTLTTVSPKHRKKLPDVSMVSPYFGLDRHLHAKDESTRKGVLDNLMESGSQFVTSQPTPCKLSVTSSVGRRRNTKLVQANDIFGNSRQKIQKTDSTIDIVKTTPEEKTKPKKVSNESGFQENRSPGRSPGIPPDLYDIPEAEETPVREGSRFVIDRPRPTCFLY